MSDESQTEWKRWVEAGKTLAVDPKAVVSCPKCGEGTLETHDVGPQGMQDRWMRCPRCGATNVLIARMYFDSTDAAP